MNPAYSVIFFTTSSGTGYGLVLLMILLERGDVVGNSAAIVGVLIGLAFITAGLFASTFHLGHPERAWRALSQWQTSWLSREGVLAVVFYGPVLLYLAGLWFQLTEALLWVSATTTVALGIATIYATSMIYASLPTIPRWNNGRVVAVYLAMAAAGGSLAGNWLASGLSAATDKTLVIAAAAVSLCWLLKASYWRHIDRAGHTATAESATGLGEFGHVTLFEAPHTSRNFVMREMGYEIARKHAKKLRGIALMLGGPSAVALLILGSVGLPTNLQMIVFGLAFIVGTAGIVVERWLFFAEAEHVATLYYGASRV